MSLKENYRKRIFDVLTGDVEILGPKGDPAREALEKLAAEDLNRLEPIIDEMLEEARNEQGIKG